ncbi:hypothetical protein tinsulaeT_17510 [Thalassotalea insulae]|uniref:GGDEF domain-containing protein n=1 Tax=Thalassotalea insulae TaxID=2056778 RepID=A0ABQ6GW67_9GAMM|nr:hypothetical protein [Thalassotalea insulae]GLX78411.1 hypothetical protein tinsulaeT_17510 [Thalassotalea insulae]
MKSSLFVLLVLFSGFFTTFVDANEAKLSELQDNIIQVDTLFLTDPESLPYQTVIELSQKVIRNRELYNANTIGKMFSLLADAAVNKGDLAKALQFSLDGEALIGLEAKLHLSLTLKVAAGYYYKGKYHQAKEIADQAVVLAKQINTPILLIKALGYRAMANAVIAEHQLALIDLQQIQQLLANYEQFNDHIHLLAVIANAHFYLGSYQTALKLYNKVLKIRFDQNKQFNIDQTYYNIARCYLKLDQLDDAFHAFNGAKQYAEKKNAPIRIAYAELGLGQVLLKQAKYDQASEHLMVANELFHGQNIPQPYLTTLLNLAQVAKVKGNYAQSYQYITQAEMLVNSTELTQEQIAFYQYLAQMYQEQGLYQQAYQAQTRYIERYKHFNHVHQHLPSELDPNNIASEKNRELSLNMAAETELKNQFAEKFNQQYQVIVSLAVVIALMVILLLSIILKHRAKRLNQQYDEIEKPTDILATPSQTKSFYQHYYKMARKFEYPLSVGYFSIDNWQELRFQFNKKVVEEVARIIATLVNEHKGEFDQVGLINEGEYLFLAPYQAPEQLRKTFEQLTNALKVQFFANLGEFSLKVGYDCQSPNVQDIDPYIFLSRLSESTRAEYSSYKT